MLDVRLVEQLLVLALAQAFAYGPKHESAVDSSCWESYDFERDIERTKRSARRIQFRLARADRGTKKAHVGRKRKAPQGSQNSTTQRSNREDESESSSESGSANGSSSSSSSVSSTSSSD